MEPPSESTDDLKLILEKLEELEPLFHAAYADANVAQFEQLVAPEFWEVGASGNRYSRDFALKVLAERKTDPDPQAWRTAEFHVSPAGGDHYLLTYTLFQPGRVTRRLPVWRCSEKGWQVIYHQGTVVQAS